VIGTSMTLVWGAVPDATHYRIRLDDATGQRLDDYYRPDQAGCATGAVCALTVSTAGFTAGLGQWWVQPWSPSAEGPWSEARPFQYAKGGVDGSLDFRAEASTGGTETARPATSPADTESLALLAAGVDAGMRTHAGPSNTHLGTAALANVTSGLFNTGLGHYAATQTTTGGMNTAVGRHALYSNTAGSSNTALGELALFRNVESHNTALGAQALFNSTTGRGNTAAGREALRAATTANWNTAVGYFAMRNTTIGWANTALGTQALFLNGTGTGNVAIGINALQSNTHGDHNVAVGQSALLSSTTQFGLTAVGFEALKANSIGNGAEEIGIENTAVGYRVLADNTSGATIPGRGSGNTGVGFEALVANTSGAGNTAIGLEALRDVTTGLNNTAVGVRALEATNGNRNVGIGVLAGWANTTGSTNIYLGDVAGVDGENNTMRLGWEAQTRTFIGGVNNVTVSNGTMVYIDTTSGQLGTMMSSGRYKEAVRGMGDASTGLLRLRPVTFRYTEAVVGPGARPLEYGLIAEEVAEVYPGLVTYDPDGRPATVQYRKINAMMLNEVQRQERTIHALEVANQQQHERISALVARLQRLEALLGTEALRQPTAP
jgi:hypothetical protein